MRREGIQAKHDVSDPEQVAFEIVCTCKRCNHGLARDCAKSECSCCKNESHSMVMDGIEGFYPVDTQE